MGFHLWKMMETILKWTKNKIKINGQSKQNQKTAQPQLECPQKFFAGHLAEKTDSWRTSDQEFKFLRTSD